MTCERMRIYALYICTVVFDFSVLSFGVGALSDVVSGAVSERVKGREKKRAY